MVVMECKSPNIQKIRACFVCNRTSCQLITHRLASLESLRRISKSKRSNQPGRRNNISTRKERLALKANLSTPHSPPVESVEALSDALLPLPVSNLDREQVGLFHDFFIRQGGSVYDAHRSLAFDVAHLPYLFPMAMQNPALCMSIIAMSATYQGIHGRSLDIPDDKILAIYARTFRELRNQIEQEGSKGISESTMMASINIMMCCGIAFNDSGAILTHWQGVRALFEEPRPRFHSGAIIAFMDALEYWLVLTCGVKPRSDEWQTPIPCDASPFQRYGRTWVELFKLPIFEHDSWATKLMELGSNSCKATEMMENHTNEDTAIYAPPETYLIYIRGIVARQGMLALSKLRNSDSVLECMAITLNLYYIIVLRRTPWKAPLQHLCAELRRALSNCEHLPISIAAHNTTHSFTDKGTALSSHMMIEDVYIWMLTLSACAAQVSKDEFNLYWTIRQLRKTRVFGMVAKVPGWKLGLLEILKSFCWSERFLTQSLEDICILLGDEDSLSKFISL